jgi:hypothetical protein
VAARLIGGDSNWLRLRWRIEGAGAVTVPPLAARGFADGLWRTTCFELFVRGEGGEAYSEFNFSPSQQWAAYDFAAPRQGMAKRDLPRGPGCVWRPGRDLAIFDAAIPRAGLPALPWAANLTCVIEEEGGVISYWSLRHGGAAPDFHDPACFVLPVSAADVS